MHCLSQDVISVDFEPLFDDAFRPDNDVDGVESARQPPDEGEQTNQNLNYLSSMQLWKLLHTSI